MSENQIQFDPALARRNRLIFIGMVILFAAPILIATYMYKSGWRPASTSNHGTLVQPPRPAPEFTLANRKGGQFDKKSLETLWNLVVVINGKCDATCSKNLFAIRQIWIAQGKNQHRVRRILIQAGNTPDLDKIASSYPELVILSAKPKALETLRTWMQIKESTKDFNGSNVYMVDPLGNFMMYYLPGYDPTGMRKDVVRLLKVSHIG